MEVEITNRPELRVAAVHHVGAYDRISEAFDRLGAIAGQAGLFGPGASMIGVYHDDPEKTPEDKLRSDAGITIQPATKLPTGLTELKIPAGRYARATYKGPYNGLPAVWSQLKSEWLPKSGHRRGDGVAYELYRNNPMNAKPEDLLTDIYIPLR
jgi:AraC family transcriptional regulator